MPEDILLKDAPDLSAILKSDLFSNLLQEERELVTGRTGYMLLRKGGLLFAPGRKAEHLFLLLKGSVRVFKPNESGRNDEIARFTPGDVIGDFDFARGKQKPAFSEQHKPCPVRNGFSFFRKQIGEQLAF